MPVKQAWRTFCNTFILTMCVLGLGMSCLVIEYNTRRVSDGEVDFGVRYTMQEGRPHMTLKGDAVRNVTDVPAVRMALSPSVQALISLWELQNQAVVYALGRLA